MFCTDNREKAIFFLTSSYLTLNLTIPCDRRTVFKKTCRWSFRPTRISSKHYNLILATAVVRNFWIAGSTIDDEKRNRRQKNSQSREDRQKRKSTHCPWTLRMRKGTLLDLERTRISEWNSNKKLTDKLGSERFADAELEDVEGTIADAEIPIEVGF